MTTYHQFHAEGNQEVYGFFKVFYAEKGQLDLLSWGAPLGKDERKDERGAGWYWLAYLPNYIPDGEASGPFESSREALEDADEGIPEFNDERGK